MAARRMSTERPTAFSEFAEVLEILPHLIHNTRRRKGLSLRAAASEIGISFTTLTRIEHGSAFNSSILPVLLRWLGRP
jgi:transcriptional regulator with XRE-family HTH domain